MASCVQSALFNIGCIDGLKHPISKLKYSDRSIFEFRFIRIDKIQKLEIKASGSYFNYDVSQYGTRYSRPDRFPRTKSPSASEIKIDALNLLNSIRSCMQNLGFDFPEAKKSSSDLKTEKENVKEKEENEEKRLSYLKNAEFETKFKQLLQFGRVDDDFELIEKYLNSNSEYIKNFSLITHLSKGERRIIDHEGFVFSCVESGNIALAFEYIGLFPPSLYLYKILMVKFLIFNHFDAAELALETAKRRKLKPDLDCVAILLLNSNMRRISEKLFNEITAEKNSVDFKFDQILEKISAISIK